MGRKTGRGHGQQPANWPCTGLGPHRHSPSLVDAAAKPVPRPREVRGPGKGCARDRRLWKDYPRGRAHLPLFFLARAKWLRP